MKIYTGKWKPFKLSLNRRSYPAVGTTISSGADTMVISDVILNSGELPTIMAKPVPESDLKSGQCSHIFFKVTEPSFTLSFTAHWRGQLSHMA
jgi:hypothetical protein